MTIPLDELNRADVDKAFGQFFTVLSGHSSELPYRDGPRNVLVLCESEEAIAESETRDQRTYPTDRFLIYRVPTNWRMIGTLNTTDKATLYQMSFAFMRRFAFVHVPLPKADRLQTICRDVLIMRVGLANTHAEALIGLWSRLSGVLPLGPAILIDMARYLKKRVLSESEVEWNAGLSESLSMYLVPHLEGIESEQAEAVRLACTPYWTPAVEEASVAFAPGVRATTQGPFGGAAIEPRFETA